jgi:hypothetical protein
VQRGLRQWQNVLSDRHLSLTHDRRSPRVRPQQYNVAVVRGVGVRRIISSIARVAYRQIRGQKTLPLLRNVV